jgi:putative SOS response-associated peptidase YedK
MCGRYTLTNVSPSLLGPLFGVEDVPELGPRFNVSPTQEAPIVRVAEPRGPRRLELARWGLVPSWAKDPSIGDRMINARAETVAEKPAFRSSFKSKRCLVVTDGFFEWKKIAGKKQPCWIHRGDGSPFAFAGLWARWKDAEGEPRDSFTILTTEARSIIADVHDRMPVFLAPDDYAAWLDPAEQRLDVLDALIRGRSPDELVITPVSTRVNNPRNEGPENVRPLLA